MSVKGVTTCDTILKKMNDFMDGELSERERAEVVAHTKNCPECAEQLEQVTRMLTMLAEMDENLVIPLDAQAAWRNAVREEAKKRGRRGAPAWVKSMAITAAALALLVGGTMFTRTGSPLLFEAPSIEMASVPQEKGMEWEWEAEDDVASSDMGYDSVSSRGGNLLLSTDGALDQPDNPLITTDDGDAVGETQQKPVVLRTATREFESTLFDEDMDNIDALVNEYGGYYEQRGISGEPLESGNARRGRTADMTARIPFDKLKDFLESLEEIGVTTYHRESAEDISSRYYDVELRLDNFRAQADRLRQLLAEAESVEDMVTIEDKLMSIQVEIDSLEGQLRGWSSQANYSNVYMTLVEVAPRDQIQPASEDLGERIKNGFYDSLNWLVRFLQDMAVFVVTIAPQLAIVLVLFLVIFFIVRAARRKRRG